MIFAILALIISIIILSINYWDKLKNKSGIGLLEITNKSSKKFYKLDRNLKNMEQFARNANIKMDNFKIWQRVLVSVNEKGVYLEDKNYKPFCFRNRRRFRKINIRHNDILDIGRKSFMFYNEETSLSPTTRRYFKKNNKKNKDSEEKIFTVSYLQPIDQKQKIFYIDKNMIFIGRSYTNDLVIRSANIANHHAIIKMINGRAKMEILTNDVITFVNGKRSEEYILTNNDEISFDNQRYKFITQ